MGFGGSELQQKAIGFPQLHSARFTIWETDLEGWIQDRDGIQWTWCDLDYLSQCTLTVMEKKNKKAGGKGGGIAEEINILQ